MGQTIAIGGQRKYEQLLPDNISNILFTTKCQSIQGIYAAQHAGNAKKCKCQNGASG